MNNLEYGKKTPFFKNHKRP